MKKLGKIGEFGLIEKIKERFSGEFPGVLVGIGDDAALVGPNPAGLLMTVDMLMEGVHFDLSYFEPEDIGHKSMAVNLSDIAAMGGVPRYALASLGLREGLADDFLFRLFDGFKPLMIQHKLALVGGNLTKSPQSLVVDLVLCGTPLEKTLTRKGARPGNLIAVTGRLGSAAAGYRAFKKHGKSARERYSQIANAQLRPIPRVEEGMSLSQWGHVTSMMDVSDGLASELGHLAESSGVGFVIEASRLPMEPEMIHFCRESEISEVGLALHGGEDYELLFTFDEKSGVPPIPHTVLGEVLPSEQGVNWVTPKGTLEKLSLTGWDHFQ